MKITGIIAEYNPFHNGHAYHIRKARELTGADYIIVVMSGNFTQRGTPALIDKYSRVRMALSCGADLVLELPLHYACSSAEYFASGAVSILNSLGCVDFLCFGCETADAGQLYSAASFLNNAENSPEYTERLKTGLKNGLSYPAARASAVSGCSGSDSDLFRLPNNILGIEYCRAIQLFDSSLQPVAVKRLGNYHANEIFPTEGYASASAIRTAISNHGSQAGYEQLPSFLAQSVPELTLPVWDELFSESGILQEDDFSSLLHYRLLSLADTSADGLTCFADITSDLADKIKKYLYQFTDWKSFCLKLKSRDLTYTRISRCLCHILLDIRQDTLSFCKTEQYPAYSRILGFRKDAAALLSRIKQTAVSPLFSSPPDGIRQLSGLSQFLLQEEIKASHIYRSVLAGKYEKPFENEYQKQIIIL